MSKIKIEIISPVHIGSGEILKYGYDFVKEGDVLGIVKPEKVIKVIGEENLNAWVLAIENGRTTDDVVKQYAPKATIRDYTDWRIDWYGGVTDLKAFIHDGLGRPYIPGSSIKGAIRTAILSTVVAEMKEAEQYIPLTDKNRYTAKAIEKQLFGLDPQNDIFRFLQVGDAIFGQNGYKSWSLCMANINERQRNGFWDTTKKQLVETLCPEDFSSFTIKINGVQYNKAKAKMLNMPKMPDCMSSLPDLFKTINSHTENLVRSEISYWQDKLDESYITEGTDEVQNYIDKMTDILSYVTSCKEGSSCILRIGHGSGWRFITGAWNEDMPQFDDIISASRPKADRYTDYDFPKSRRVELYEQDALGFVKLTIQNT